MSQLEEMQCFVRVVEAGSITKAAEQMNTVKSAISKRLTDLERRLGVSLLKRTTRKQTLTDAGRSYYQHCVRILDDIYEVEHALGNEQTSLSGRIRLSAPISFGLMHLSPALREFNLIHPEIIFDIDFSDRHQDLVAEGLDLAIRISNLTDSSLIARKLASTRLQICGSPDYFARNGLPEKTEDLLYGHVKLHYSHVSSSWSLLDYQGQAISVNLPTVLSSNNGEYLRDVCITGKGLILTPDFISYPAIKSGKLITVLDNALVQKDVGIYAIYPQTRFLSHRVRILIDFLRDYFAKLKNWECPAR
ncbi:LysR family transcriptional regulator [Methylophaga thalassica]|jgi:DNA-binding transcriptional LysR family regulator|uniref:LysR family transcriptional regulator n=1 Tax=Methylophaga thalassica TaxID=40223 RepID=A0ABQ5TV98_9GAMM|nr:LysR family transcriptional regulator [Methylophaga thalassica]GLP99357.1 LysR family transcriptional regulator [Methylophaga thalassica]